jgi:hypothetical protein
MVAKVKNFITHESVCGVRGKKTSIGRKNLMVSSMNKDRKRSFKKYRGQGK